MFKSEHGRCIKLAAIALLLALGTAHAQIVQQIVNSAAPLPVYYQYGLCHTATTSCPVTLTVASGVQHNFHAACFTATTQTCSLPTGTGLTFTQANASVSDTTNTSGTSETFSSFNVGSGSITVTFHFSGTSGEGVGILIDFSSPLNALDKTPTVTIPGAGSTSWTSDATTTLSVPNEIVFACMQRNNSSETLTASAPWAMTSYYFGSGCEYQIVTSTASVSGLMTASAVNFWLPQIASYK